MSTLTTERAVASAYEQRLTAVADTSLGGRAFCHQLAEATDAWIVALAALAREQHPRAPRFALVAVGGYGRGELSPFSDIDLLLVHRSSSNRLEAVASAIWYPIWDAGLKLGHAVRSIDETLVLAKSDLDTATALLTARHVAGDPKLGVEVVESGRAAFSRRRKKWLSELQRRVRARQAGAGDVAYILEPDLKDGHGGIRDAQSLWWAERGGLSLSTEDNAALNEC
ncbi:MAG: nucleotidyltransferase domain-containing protein, partial [Acidimicrobiia bacterium]